MPENRDVVTVERVIPAPPKPIFELLADPRRHREIDGSGSVRDPSDPPARLALGSKFTMAMKLGVPYTMVNEVIEFEEGRRIAWQPRLATRIGRGFGGRVWRYELEPVDGGTRVRETWDISDETVKLLVRPAAKRTREAMSATLERIEAIVTATA
jgi:uncharacterized protein YndB with AHSA1/START domain